MGVAVDLTSGGIFGGRGNARESQCRGVRDAEMAAGADQERGLSSGDGVEFLPRGVSVDVEPGVIVATGQEPTGGRYRASGGGGERRLQRCEGRCGVRRGVDLAQRFAVAHRMGVVVVEAREKGAAVEIHDAGVRPDVVLNVRSHADPRDEATGHGDGAWRFARDGVVDRNDCSVHENDVGRHTSPRLERRGRIGFHAVAMRAGAPARRPPNRRRSSNRPGPLRYRLDRLCEDRSRRR